MNVFGGVLVGAAGSILGLAIIALFTRMKIGVGLLGAPFRLGLRMRRAGITRFQVSREDYPHAALSLYLERARHSLAIVSVSLKVTHDEGNLVSFFRRQLARNPAYRIRISLLNPRSVGVNVLAPVLDLSPTQLREEIKRMLEELYKLKCSLPDQEAQRFDLLVRESIPMGSAILLDATPESGTIQIETKLYRAPRVESFGFEVVAPSVFYRRNYDAWTRILDESRQVTSVDLT